MPMSMNKYLTAAVLGVVGLSSGALANTATGASFDKPKDGKLPKQNVLTPKPCTSCLNDFRVFWPLSF